MDTELERRLWELAARQHGVVARGQMLELGMRPGAIGRRARRGGLRRLHRGVYQVGPVLAPSGRLLAATLACGRQGIVADWSAAVVWRVREGSDGEPVHILLVGGGGRSRPGIRVRRVRRLDPDERTCVDGIPVTTPARTLLDLAAVAGAGELERAVARAERERLVSRDQLRAMLLRGAGRPGAPALRALLSQAGGPALTRSEAEALFLKLIREASLPLPETNVVVGGYELDFLWRKQRIAVEVDGYRYHGTRRRFEADRRRATRLAALGIQVIPVTYRQIVEQRTATAVQIGNALLRAELR